MPDPVPAKQQAQKAANKAKTAAANKTVQSCPNKAITKKALEHIFHGEINKSGKAVGFHHEGAGEMKPMNNTKTIAVTSAPNARGVYEAKVQVKGVQKAAKSTFFPKTWTQAKVIEAIGEAHKTSKKVNPSKPSYAEGKSSDGMTIGMYLNKNGTIATAFPIYNK